ncbi:MAG: PKD domain-containing protein [Ktedonobacterales bacterium]
MMEREIKQVSVRLAAEQQPAMLRAGAPYWSAFSRRRIGATLLRVGLILTVTLLLGGGLTVWSLVSSATISLDAPTQGHVAWACGLGSTPTMVANNAPALAFPLPPNVSSDLPAGQFALNYVMNQPIAFHEDLSRVPGAPDPNSLQWRWNFGDGTGWVQGVKVTHTFATSGVHTVESDIFDTTSNAWTLLDNAQMRIIGASVPNPPVAVAHALTTPVIGANGSITFDASGSHATVGSQLTYLWNFGDNTSATGSHVTHQFTSPGQGIVALIVTDARGAKAVATINVLIVIALPTAKVSASATSAAAGSAISFDASGSQPPPDPANDQLTKFSWNFGDGTASQTTQQPTISHTFEKAGTFTVTAQAIDQQGAAGAGTIKVTITGVAGGMTSGGGANWLLIGGFGVLLLVVAVAAYLWIERQREAQILQQRQMAQEMARVRRANRVNRPANGQRGPSPRTGNQDGPHQGASGAYGGYGPNSGPQRPPRPQGPQGPQGPQHGQQPVRPMRDPRRQPPSSQEW